MWNTILYYILYGWVKLHALLPMPILYVFSDIFYFIAYRVVHYRVRVVRRNLANSFPEKSVKELRKLEREFYHHLADYIVETMKLAHISLDELHRRAKLRNPELIDKLMDEGHTCVVMLMGHYGNWEWFCGSPSCFKEAHVYDIYRPLKNQAFDRLFIKLRSAHGSRGIKKNDTIRDIIRIKQSGERAVVVFLADQTPSKANLHYWTQFLHQESAMLTGAERIAQKMNLPIVFTEMRKVKRGYYTVDFQLITDTPKETPEFWITEQYTRRMEANILRNPAYWLWSHKRWKYKRETTNAPQP